MEIIFLFGFMIGITLKIVHIPVDFFGIMKGNPCIWAIFFCEQ